MAHCDRNWSTTLFLWVQLAALAAFVFWLTIIVYWRDFRHLGAFHMTIYADRISYDPKMVERFRRFAPMDLVSGGSSLRHSLIFHGVQNEQPLRFEKIAGVTHWRPWYSAAVKFYATLSDIDIETNRLANIRFYPQSEDMPLTEALQLAEDVRTWFLKEGFDYAPPRAFGRLVSEPQIAFRDEDFLISEYEINPSLAPIMRQASKAEDPSEHGFFAFRGARGDMTAEVVLLFSSPDYQPKDRPFEDYDITVIVTIADIGGVRMRLEEDCRTSLPQEDRRCMRLRAGTWPNPLPDEPPYPPYLHPNSDLDCDGVNDLHEHEDDVAIGAC